jgi:glycosyltransferase involved in cell wall biosynthesis
MCDGDDTYKGYELLRLVEPLNSGFAKVVIGSRMAGKMKAGSMKGFNRFGNWFFSFLVRVVYRVNVTDTLTGYFAWDREVIVQLRQHLKSAGFAIEMEMITKMARLGYLFYSVPITYEPRLGESALRPIHDGARILREFARQLHWCPRVEHVAFVSDAIYPYNKGGKEKRLHELSRRLVKDGRKVTIYTMQWWDGPRSMITKDGVELYAISRLHPLYKHERRSISEALLFSLACLKLLRRDFDTVDVDSMPFFPLFTMRLVCALKRRKLYATWHEVWGKQYWHQYMKGTGAVFGRFVEWCAMKMPHVIIANSEHTTNRLHALGVRQPVHTVPLGVDVESILTITPHELQSDAIFIGRLLDNKNVDLLIRALKIVKDSKPDVSCIIVGQGPEHGKLERLAKELKLTSNITFFDAIESHEELYALIKASKMLVQPSTREGFGIVVVEAMACNVPAITTRHDLNAARDLIIEGRNGLLTDVSAEQLAAHMQSIIAGHDMQPLDVLHEMFNHYSWQTAATKLEEVLVPTK